MTDPKSPKSPSLSIADLVAAVLARAEASRQGSEAKERRKLASANIAQANKRKRAKLRQVAALGALHDLLNLGSDRCRERNLEATRSWLHDLSCPGSFGALDAVTLLTAASASESTEDETLLVALALGEEPRDRDGNLVPLARHVQAIKSRPGEELKAKPAAPKKARKEEHRSAGEHASRAFIAGMTSGGGDDEDLSDLDESEDGGAEADE